MVFCSNKADCQDFSDANTCTAPNSDWCAKFNAIPEIIRESNPCAEGVQRCVPDAYGSAGNLTAVEQCINGNWVTVKGGTYCQSGGGSQYANIYNDMSRLEDLGNSPVKILSYPEPVRWAQATLYPTRLACDPNVMSCATPEDFAFFEPDAPQSNLLQTPIPAELWDIQLKTNMGFLLPDIPFWLVDKIRAYGRGQGWLISGIHKTQGGYLIQAEKVGSPIAPIFVAGIIAFFVLIGVIIVSWTATRLSDNKTEQSTEETKQEFLSFCELNPNSEICKQPELFIAPPKIEEKGILSEVKDFLPIFIGLAVVGVLVSMRK